jgi:multiple sugar transport system permease protein
MVKKQLRPLKPIKTGYNNYLFPGFELRNPGTMAVYRIWGAITIVGAFGTMIPFFWMLISAMMPVKYVFAPVSQVLANLTFDLSHFKKAWEITPFTKYFFNSLIVAVAVVTGQVFISAMAAYAISKLKPTGYKIVLLLFMSTMLIPFETTTIPLYLFMRDFTIPLIMKTNLLNTYWALILPALANAFNIFIFKSFFDKLPDDFIEAARVDGYSETGIFFKIIIPVSKPILIVMAILNFVNIWNSFFWPLIVVNEPEIYTLMLGIYKIIEEGQPWNVVMAAVTISMVPTVILFALFQRQIMKGVVFTSLQE